MISTTQNKNSGEWGGGGGKHLFQFLKFVFPVVVIECAAEEDDLSSDDICAGEISLFSAVCIHCVCNGSCPFRIDLRTAGRGKGRNGRVLSLLYILFFLDRRGGGLLRVCTRWDGGEHDHADLETKARRNNVLDVGKGGWVMAREGKEGFFLRKAGKLEERRNVWWMHREREVACVLIYCVCCVHFLWFRSKFNAQL